MIRPPLVSVVRIHVSSEKVVGLVYCWVPTTRSLLLSKSTEVPLGSAGEAAPPHTVPLVVAPGSRVMRLTALEPLVSLSRR